MLPREPRGDLPRERIAHAREPGVPMAVRAGGVRQADQAARRVERPRRHQFRQPIGGAGAEGDHQRGGDRAQFGQECLPEVAAQERTAAHGRGVRPATNAGCRTTAEVCNRSARSA